MSGSQNKRRLKMSDLEKELSNIKKAVRFALTAMKESNIYIGEKLDQIENRIKHLEGCSDE